MIKFGKYKLSCKILLLSFGFLFNYDTIIVWSFQVCCNLIDSWQSETNKERQQQYSQQISSQHPACSLLLTQVMGAIHHD